MGSTATGSGAQGSTSGSGGSKKPVNVATVNKLGFSQIFFSLFAILIYQQCGLKRI
jgi:hypothetical protein